MKKKILFIILIIVLLSSLTCVNAKYDNNTLQLTDNNLTQSNSIKELITHAKDNETIYLDNTTYSGEQNTQITIDKSINFVGSDNTIIDAKNKSGIFTIMDNVKVSFKNIKFINAYKSGNNNVYGASLEINNATVTINNCQFISNKISYGSSGDIYGAAISNKGNISIFNSYFLENSLNSMREHNGYGGSIYNKGYLYVNNTLFIKSKGGEYSKGSAIYNDGIALINNSVICESYSLEESMGSAIFNNGDLTLLHSKIENNTIERNNFNFIYGNIFNAGLLIAYGNIFKNNTGYYKQPNSGYEGCPTIYNVGELNLSYNAFIDNVGGFKKIYTDLYLNGGQYVDIDNNWWGSNDNPYNTQAINIDKVNSWLILNITPIYSMVNINEMVNVSVSWKLNNNLEPKLLLPFDMDFSDDFGHTQKINLANKNSTFTFNNTQYKGLYKVNISLYSFKQSVFIDVGKIKTQIQFQVNNNIYSNEDLIIQVNLYDEKSNLINGKLYLTLYNQTKIINLNNGSGYVVFTKLIPNNYDLKLEFEGDEDYFKSFNQTCISIKKYPINLTIEEINNIKVDENFTITVNLNNLALNGAANLYINKTFKQRIYLKNGDNFIEFSNFNEGKYNITIEMLGDEYYQTTNISTVFNVYKYDSLINIIAEDVFINNSAILKINILNEFRGEVILSINDVNNTLFLNNPSTMITLNNLSEGVYDVDLIFKGNGKFNPCKISTSFKVIKHPSNLSVTINNNLINVKTSFLNCTGNISVYINNKFYQSEIINGEVNFIVDFDEGTNYIYVLYNGDEYYASSSFNTTIGEGEAILIIGENVTSYEYNDFNYTVQIFEKNGLPIPNKNISVKVNSQMFQVITNNQGLGILSLNLGKGYYEVTSSYDNLTTKNYFTINPIEFNLTSKNITYGENTTIIAEFNRNISGKVNFTLFNGLTFVTDIIDGKSICIIRNLTCGLWEVNAYYMNDIFNSSSKKTTFQVEKLNPIINLNIKEAFVGQEETIIVKGCNLSGNITFIVDGEKYTINPVADEYTLTLPNLDVGNHMLEVKYSGDEYHKNITLFKKFSIKSQKTNILLLINDTCYGDSITVNAKVNNDALGNITFFVNNIIGVSQINNGIAIWRFNGLNTGSYSIKANYSGDNQFLSAFSEASFKVIKANSNIELYVNEVYLDENIRIFAKLNQNATGKVSFSMENYYSQRYKEIKNSTASWYISPLQTGQYTIHATYSGDNNYLASSTTYILNVSQVKSFLTLDVNDATNNESASIKVRLISNNNEKISGIVEIQLGLNSYKINVYDGEGLLYVGKLNPGEYMVKAIYNGSDKFAKSTSNVSFTVYDHLLETILTCDDVIKYYNDDVKFVVSLTNAKNKPISSQIIYININGIVGKYMSDNSGKVYLDINETYGKYDVYVEFRGSKTYRSSNASATIEILSTIESGDVLKVQGSGVQYFALFKDLNGKALSNTNVMFNIAGKSYNYTTLPNGVVKLNINLNSGKYEIIAINPVTSENKTNFIYIYSRLMENNDVINYYGAKSTYKVRINGDDGNPVGEGVIVTFKVYGKTYDVKTDKQGYASVSLKLKPNQYIITAQCNGSEVFNKITVKPVLSTKITSNKKTKKTKFKAKLLNFNGKPLKGKKITFKIKNKKYAAKTNKNGFAYIKIKLNLKKGVYKVYTIYGKSKVINTIKIKK